MERGKVTRTDGTSLTDGQDMKDIDVAGYTYLRILETDKIREKEMKEKINKDYLWWLKWILRSKLNGRNKIIAVDTWAVSVMRYSTGILKWSTDELKSLNIRTRKFKTILGALHPKNDATVYILVRKWERGDWQVVRHVQE